VVHAEQPAGAAEPGLDLVAMRSVPYSSHAARMRGQKSSGGTIAPASPWIGSMITAATPLPVWSAL
jgi:hypothetical protein